MQDKNSIKYIEMWNSFAQNKSISYLTDKYSASNIVGLTGLARENEIFRYLDLKSEHEMIDVGCASGHQVFKAAEICKRVVGVDVGVEFIDTAKRIASENNVNNVEFLLTEGDTLPFPDKSFDRLICSEVLEHVINVDPFLDELIRVVKVGGGVVFTVPNLNNRGTLYKRIKDFFKPVPFIPITDFSMEGIKKHGDAHVRQFTLKTFSEFAEKHGLKVERLGGAAFVDGPKIGPIIRIINKPKFMQDMFFAIERIIAKIPLFKYCGRHIVLKARRVI